MVSLLPKPPALSLVPVTSQGPTVSTIAGLSSHILSPHSRDFISTHEPLGTLRPQPHCSRVLCSEQRACPEHPAPTPAPLMPTHLGLPSVSVLCTCLCVLCPLEQNHSFTTDPCPLRKLEARGPSQGTVGWDPLPPSALVAAGTPSLWPHGSESALSAPGLLPQTPAFLS